MPCLVTCCFSELLSCPSVVSGQLLVFTRGRKSDGLGSLPGELGKHVPCSNESQSGPPLETLQFLPAESAAHPDVLCGIRQFGHPPLGHAEAIFDLRLGSVWK